MRTHFIQTKLGGMVLWSGRRRSKSNQDEEGYQENDYHRCSSPQASTSCHFFVHMMNVSSRWNWSCFACYIKVYSTIAVIKGSNTSFLPSVLLSFLHIPEWIDPLGPTHLPGSSSLEIHQIQLLWADTI